MKTCYRCGGEATHQTLEGNFVCHKNAAKCPEIKLKFSAWQVGKTPWNKGVKGGKSWNKGLTKDNHPSLKQAGIKLKEKYANGTLKKAPLTKEGRERISKSVSKAIKKRYEEGWMPKAGRCKKIKYSSPMAGEVMVDGTWELKVAEYFDQNKINWERNLKRFPYKNLKGTESHYTPDFYLPDFNLYVEVKGYETDLDRCKWRQFPENLEVWKKAKMKELNLL